MNNLLTLETITLVNGLAIQHSSVWEDYLEMNAQIHGMSKEEYTAYYLGTQWSMQCMESLKQLSEKKVTRKQLDKALNNLAKVTQEMKDTVLLWRDAKDKGNSKDEKKYLEVLKTKTAEKKEAEKIVQKHINGLDADVGLEIANEAKGWGGKDVVKWKPEHSGGYKYLQIMMGKEGYQADHFYHKEKGAYVGDYILEIPAKNKAEEKKIIKLLQKHDKGGKVLESFLNEDISTKKTNKTKIKVGDFVNQIYPEDWSASVITRDGHRKPKYDVEWANGLVLSVKGKNVEVNTWSGKIIILPIDQVEYNDEWNNEEEPFARWSSYKEYKMEELIPATGRRKKVTYWDGEKIVTWPPGKLNMSHMIKTAGKELTASALGASKAYEGDLDVFIDWYLKKKNINPNDFDNKKKEEIRKQLSTKYDIIIHPGVNPFYESVNEGKAPFPYNLGYKGQKHYWKYPLEIGDKVKNIEGIKDYHKIAARGGKTSVHDISDRIIITTIGQPDIENDIIKALKGVDDNLDLKTIKSNYGAPDSSRSKHEQDNDMWKWEIQKKEDFHSWERKYGGKPKKDKEFTRDHQMKFIDMLAPYSRTQHELADIDITSLKDFLQYAADHVSAANLKKVEKRIKKEYPMLENKDSFKNMLTLESFSDFINEGKMPDKYIGNDEIVYLKTKEDSKGANYNLYYKGHDIDKGGRRFGSEKELKDFAADYILSNQWYKKLRYEDPKPLPESVNEGKYYITRNLGRGQGMSLVKDLDKPKEFKSYKDAKKEADRLERGSRNMTAYFVSDKDMKIVFESVNEAKMLTLKDYLKKLDSRIVDGAKAVSGMNGDDSKIEPTRGDILQNFQLFRNYITSLIKRHGDNKTKLKFLSEQLAIVDEALESVDNKLEYSNILTLESFKKENVSKK